MIDYSRIPEPVRMDLVAAIAESAKRAFQDPDYQKAYEEWAAERRERKDG